MYSGPVKRLTSPWINNWYLNIFQKLPKYSHLFKLNKSSIRHSSTGRVVLVLPTTTRTGADSICLREVGGGDKNDNKIGKDQKGPGTQYNVLQNKSNPPIYGNVSRPFSLVYFLSARFFIIPDCFYSLNKWKWVISIKWIFNDLYKLTIITAWGLGFPLLSKLDKLVLASCGPCLVVVLSGCKNKLA